MTHDPLSTIPYMRFAKSPERTCAFPMTGSASPPIDFRELGFDPASLELYTYNPYGDPQLIARIAESSAVPENEIFIASSVTHAHFCVGVALCEPGDVVLAEKPGYTPIVDALTVRGVRVESFARRPEAGWELPDAGTLIARAREVDAKIVCVTDLHNPTGVALTARDRQTLVDVAEAGFEVLVDETYRPFIDPEPRTLRLDHDRLHAFEGLNKVHGIPQIRVGWSYTRPDVIERARRALDATTVHTSCLSDQVAVHAMGELDRLRDRAQKISAEGWGIVRPWLEEYDFECTPPTGGFTVFPKPPAKTIERHGSAEKFIEAAYEHGVGLTPGHFFGDPERFRMGFARVAELRDALARLAQLV